MHEDRSRSPRHHTSGSRDGYNSAPQYGTPPIALADAVHRFCADNGIDANGLTSLMEAPPHIQQAIMQEGRITGRNPSAILLSRLKRAQADVPQDPVSSFVVENHLDQAAEQRLRELSPQVQQTVLAEGPLVGARNPSAVLFARIKRVENSSHAGASQDSVSMFVAENHLDQAAEQRLQELSPQVQQMVLAEGPLVGARNPSAVLFARIKRVENSSQSYGPPPQQYQYSSAFQSPPQHRGYGPPIGAPAAGPTHWPRDGYNSAPQYGTPPIALADAVHRFCADNGIDANGLTSLMEAPPHIQQAIMQEGRITGRNPSAILLSRLRRAQADVPQDPVSLFVAENHLDQAAEQRLRELSPQVQQMVLAEGPLVGARNPSAVLFARIKRVEQPSQSYGPPPQQYQFPSAFPPPPQHRGYSPPVHAQGAVSMHSSSLAKQTNDFIVSNSINEDVGRQLHEADPRIQQQVIEEGAITGRNPSAVLLSRIRRATTF